MMMMMGKTDLNVDFVAGESLTRKSMPMPIDGRAAIGARRVSLCS